MPLKQNKLEKSNDFKEFTTFVSLTWPSSRDFYSLFGLATEPRGFPTGLFLFGYLPDSGANDPRLCLTHERVLEGSVGDSGFKGSLLVTRKSRGFENWLYDSVDSFESFPKMYFYSFKKAI